MRFAAVSAERQVGAGHANRCRGNRGVCMRSTLAAEGKGSVVVFTMRAGTERAVHARRVAEVRVVTPRTTADAVGCPHVERRLPEEANRQANVDRAIDEGLHPGSSLGVPDVEVDGAGVCTPGIANDPGWGS